MAFNLATTGNPMAHADLRMSDRANATVATNISNVTLMDTRTGGSSAGLGVVSNGNAIFATYKDIPRFAKYDSNGNELWNRDILFNDTAWASVPLVSTLGETIMAHSVRVARLGTGGVAPGMCYMEVEVRLLALF